MGDVADDAGMLEGGEGMGLPREAERAAGGHAGEDLERDRAAGEPIDRAVDMPHPAGRGGSLYLEAAGDDVPRAHGVISIGARRGEVYGSADPDAEVVGPEVAAVLIRAARPPRAISGQRISEDERRPPAPGHRVVDDEPIGVVAEREIRVLGP